MKQVKSYLTPKVANGVFWNSSNMCGFYKTDYLDPVRLSFPQAQIVKEYYAVSNCIGRNYETNN